MRDFYKLNVWRCSHKFTLDIYKISDSFPKKEIFGITNQLRRASASIGANIAEGCGRQTNKDLIRFLSISLGSASEVEYFLILCKDLGYLKINNFEAKLTEIQMIKKMLTSFINKLISFETDGKLKPKTKNQKP